MCKIPLAAVGCDPATTQRRMLCSFWYLSVNTHAGASKGVRAYICMHAHAYSQVLKRREALKQPRRQRRQLIAAQIPAQAQAASDWRGGCLTRAPRPTRAHPSHPCSSGSVWDAHVCPCTCVSSRTERMRTHAHTSSRAPLCCIQTNKHGWHVAMCTHDS